MKCANCAHHWSLHFYQGEHEHHTDTFHCAGGPGACQCEKWESYYAVRLP